MADIKLSRDASSLMDILDIMDSNIALFKKRDQNTNQPFLGIVSDKSVRAATTKDHYIELLNHHMYSGEYLSEIIQTHIDAYSHIDRAEDIIWTLSQEIKVPAYGEIVSHPNMQMQGLKIPMVRAYAKDKVKINENELLFQYA